MNTRVKVGKVELRTPLILASGHITETPDFYANTIDCAGMVTRTLKEFPPPDRKETPSPRYVVFDNGHSMLNCEWGNSIPWTEWRDHGVNRVKELGGVVIVSLSGRDIESCCHLIKEFDKLGVDAYEINISCAHFGALHGNLNVDFTHMDELLGTIRPLTTTPIWVKLSYSDVLTDMAKRAEKLGADAIVCTNSIGPGMFINIETAAPALGVKGGAGGVTGRVIFPIALRCVYELASSINIPIVGSGGISSAEDVIQMLMAGASAVELYTEPAINGPDVFVKIMEELKEYFYNNCYRTCNDIIGKALHKRDEHSFARHPAIIDLDSCISCGRCASACNFGAIIEANHQTFKYDIRKCVGCTACASVCFTKAISFTKEPYA